MNKYLLNGKPITVGKTKQVKGVKYKLKENENGCLILTSGKRPSGTCVITIITEKP